MSNLSNNNTQDFYVELVRLRGTNSDLTLDELTTIIKTDQIEYKAFGISEQAALATAKRVFRLGNVLPLPAGVNDPNLIGPSNITRIFDIATLGDSITETYNGTEWNDGGYVAWLRRLLKKPYAIQREDNFAVGGTGTDHLVTVQLPQLLASGCGIAMTMNGINDIRNDFTSAEIISNFTIFYDALDAALITSIALPILPTDSGGPNLLTDAQAKEASKVNRWLLERSVSKKNMYYFSLLDEWTDYSTGLAITELLRDDIHPNKKGGLVQATKLASDFTDNFGGATSEVDIYGNIYDASLNPKGNIFLNSYMRGTGGAAEGGVTGIVSDDNECRRINSNASFDVVASKEVVDNKTYQVMTPSGTGDGSDFRFRADLSTMALPASWVDGDVIEASCEVIWEDLSGVDSAQLKIGNFGSTSSDGASTAAQGIIPSSFSGRYRAKGVISSGSSSVYLDFMLHTINGEEVSGVFKITNVTVIKL